MQANRAKKVPTSGQTEQTQDNRLLAASVKGQGILNKILNENAVVVIAARGNVVVASLIQNKGERLQGEGNNVREALYGLYNVCG